MSRAHLVPLALLAALAAGAAAASGAPATHGRASEPVLRYGSPAAAVNDSSTSTSSNWAGYAVAAGAAFPAGTTFSNVYGTWIQPAATCTSGQASYSAFWVGLGGFDTTSQALEQIGTAADCDPARGATYFAWYELVPAASVRLKLAVRPGDAMSGAVTVAGQVVSLRIRDLTNHTVVNRKLRMASPDLSSAELIAEAPSSCNKAGRCHLLPLANFGTVTFTSGAATAASRSATFGDPAWSATEIDLQQGGGGPEQLSPGTPGASAVPTVLGANGSFSVTWQQASATPSAP
jgi:Peptidase A4 family